MNENRPSTSSVFRIVPDSSTSRQMEQEIKEESLENEERPVELDHNFCLLEPKLEEIDDFLEPKLKEPEYFNTEQPEIKLEPVELLEVVEQELLEPKLEEPDYSEMDCSFEYSNYMDSTQENSSEAEAPRINGQLNSTFLINIKNKRKPPNYKCQVCDSLEPEFNITRLQSNERKLAILVGLICAGKKTMEEAQRLFDRHILNICKTHLSEAVDDIYKSLNIENIHEIDLCSEENKQKLMSVVNMLFDGMKFDRFVGVFTDFLKKIDHRSTVRMDFSSLEPDFSRKQLKLPNYKCAVCNSLVPKIDTYRIQSNERKLILLVGFVCAGKMTMEEAQSLLTRTILSNCKVHPLEAVDEIYKALNIENVQEIDSCSEENKQKLMNAVKFLCGGTNFDCFIGVFADFLRKFNHPSAEKRHFSFLEPNISKKPSCVPKQRETRHRCSVCSLSGDSSRVANISSKNRILILMIGCILSGKMTMEEARLVLLKKSIFTCGSHLSKAANEIFKAMNIKKIDELQSCSMENQKTLMNTVNSFCPMTFCGFCSIFTDFFQKVVRNRFIDNI